MTSRSLTTVTIGFPSIRSADVLACIKSFRNPAREAVRNSLDGARVIHFVSISTIDIPEKDSVILIELSADCEDDQALSAFTLALSPDLQAMLSTAGISPPADLWKWFCAHKRRLGVGPFATCGLPFDGSPGLSVQRIQNEKGLAEWVEANAASWRGALSPNERVTRIRAALWAEGSFKWAFAPAATPILDRAPRTTSTRDKLVVVARVLRRTLIWPSPVVPFIFGAFLLLPHAGGWLWWVSLPVIETIGVLVAVAAIFSFALRRVEQTDAAPDARPRAKDMEDVLLTENVTSQNVLLTTSVLKPGMFRRCCLHLAFLGIREVLPLRWAPGRLGDLDDIHFARWVLLPGTNVLVFRSHYDGSWLSYLQDFVLRAPQGVTLIWSNTLGFPRTRWMLSEGATDGPRFLQWARMQTRPAPFWYSAYPDLPMSRIRLHARIARAIATGKIDTQLSGYLASLGDAGVGHS